MLWRGWRGAAYSMSKKLLSSLPPFWRDWFLDIFFKKCPLSFTMVLFFHTFGGGRCFILVFLDPSSFLCHSILFQETDFPLSFQKSPLPSTIALCFHTLKGGAAWAWPISLQNPSLPSLIPCWGDWFHISFEESPLSSIIVLPTVLLRRLSSLLLSKYYPSILWWGGFAYFIALLPYPLWFPLWGVAVSINSQTLLYHPSLPYHIILWRGAQLGLSPPQMLFYPHSFPLSSLTLLHFSLKVMISIYFFKSSL